MGDQGLNREPTTTGAGWASTAMSWLGRVTQVVEISLCWFLGVLAGGVVLGWLPASSAAGAVLHRLTGPDPSDRPISEFFERWRSEFWRTNAVGWPATVALLVLTLNLWVLSRGGAPWMMPMLLATVVVGVILLLGVGFLLNLMALPVGRGSGWRWLWRTSLVMPLVSPGTLLVWAICMVLMGMVALVLPVVGVLAGPGYVALVTAWLTRRRLHATGVAVDPDQAEEPRTMTS